VHTGVVTGGMLKGIQEYSAVSGSMHRHLAAWSLRRPSELSHVCQDRTLIYGHHQFVIQILILLSSCTHSPDRLLCLACYKGRVMCVGLSALCFVCVCAHTRVCMRACNWLMVDRQVRLLRFKSSGMW
jgi:hypothetical protein